MGVALTIVLVLLFVGRASSTELFVPADFRTLADAVAAASHGDTVTIASGVYSGPGFSEM